MSEEFYYDVRSISYNTALPIVKCPTKSEDIAQNVCIKYLQSKRKIDNHFAWAKVVSRNEAINYLKLRNKTQHLSEVQGNLLVDQKQDEESEVTTALELEEVKELLSKQDFRVYKLYIKHNRNVTKIAKSLKTTKSATYDYIYRMKRNLTASKFLDMGWRGTDKIISYNNHIKIKRFIDEYLKACKKNDFSRMHKYLSELETEEIPTIEYAQLVDYKLHLRKDNLYNLCLPFVRKDGKINMIQFVINDDLNEKLRVMKIHLQAKNIIRVKITKEYQDSILPRVKGLLQESAKEMEMKMLNAGGYYQEED